MNRKILLLLAVCLGLAARDGIAAPAPRRRALLIGINDYTASRLGRPTTAPQRDWPNLAGAVNDVGALEEMLGLIYGFD